ncbi:NUDIX hydrolase [Nocardia sp. alder85J]|uniref:NUDIX domain-containing protein n=1 Tax=Nocardia sp. alder85J TaxID=2862949 RepID=UPI001CD1E402
MPVKALVRKAVCYIVRDDRLLVHRHPGHSWEQVGVQVPAGTVRDGESAADAAIREAGEETGLTGCTTEAVEPVRRNLRHRPPRQRGRNESISSTYMTC